MADVTITAASVVPGANAIEQYGKAGATITAGQVVYKDSSNLIQLADNNVSATEAAAVGIAANGASLNQPITYYSLDDDLTIGGTVVAGTSYVLSSTAGGIAPAADLASGNYITLIGVAKTTAKLSMKIDATGATHG